MAKIALTLSIIAVLLGGSALVVALTRDDDSAPARQWSCFEPERGALPEDVQAVAYCPEP